MKHNINRYFFSGILFFVFSLFFIFPMSVRAASYVTCDINASVNGNNVTVSGHVTEHHPELDPSYTTIDISDSGGGSGSGTGEEGASANYTGYYDPGVYTAYVYGAGNTHPGNTFSDCTAQTNFTVYQSAPDIINGSCGNTHYNCNAGSSTNQNNGANAWTWTCAGSNGGSDASCSETKPVVPVSVSVSASPTSVVSGGRSDISWTSSNATDCYGTGGEGFYGQGLPVSGSTAVYPTVTTTYRVTCSNSGSSSYGQATVSVTQPSMSGTLTPSSSTCTIASGASSCTSSTLSWTTTNPVGTSSVTNNGSATPASPSGNSGSQAFTVPYNSGTSGVTTFYLYNNGVQLALATVTASCTSGTTWDGSKCAVPIVPGMSGTLTPSTQTCTIASGGNSCTATLSWTTTNPVGTSAVTNNGSATPASSSGNTGTNVVFAVPYNTAMSGVTTFYLYNNSQQLALATVNTSCTSGTTWNGSSCSPSVMSGTLTPSSSTCTIASGASSCTSSALSWTTTNPVGTSSVTNNGSATPASPSGNNGSQAFTVPYNSGTSGVTTFYLYNNGVQLALATVTASCTSGTTWDGSVCKDNALIMSGTLSGSNCFIDVNGTSCVSPDLTWATTNPEATSSIISSYPAPNTVVFNGNNGGPTPVQIPYGNRTFYLYNNSKSLVPASPNGSGITITSSCTSGTAWDGSKCANTLLTPFSLDLKINGSDHSKVTEALNALKGEVVHFSWFSFGNSSLSCWSEDGGTGDGWAQASRSLNNTNLDFTLPSTVGQFPYTLKCKEDTSLGMVETKNVFSFFEVLKRALAATFTTISDVVWVNIDIIKTDINPVHDGESITISWQCPAGATSSIGVNFDTGGATSGSVNLVPDKSKTYSVICNDSASTEGSVSVTVYKRPIFFNN